VADCPLLKSVVQTYCRGKGLTEWFAVCAHIGGACSPCHRRLLGQCREELAARRFPPREWMPEDIAQVLFSRVLEHRWQPEKAPLGGWLSLIIRRIVIDATKSAYARRNTPASDLPQPDDSDPLLQLLPDDHWGDPAESAMHQERRQKVRDALASLPLEEKQLITLRSIEGYKLQDMADELGMPLATAARRLQKAFDHLAQLLGDLDETPRPRSGGEA
jgi:RNA polymerase sigma-70 factor (ECF subfamily)